MKRSHLAVVVCCLAACARRPAPGAERATMWFGGDVHLGEHAEQALLPLTSRLHGVGVVNLEGPIGDGAGQASAERLLNSPRAGDALALAGVAVAGVENNHADDDGPPGRARTRAALERAGVLPAGEAQLAVGPVRVAVAAFDLGHGVPEGFAARLRAAKAGAQVLVVSLHVTAPPLLLPEPELERAVELALAAQASVVVAHGTHAVARVERRGGAVIAWGLGNLTFDCRCTDEHDGLVLEVELERDGSVSAATAVPIDAGLHGAPAGLSSQPELMLQLLESLGSSPLRRTGAGAAF